MCWSRRQRSSWLCTAYRAGAVSSVDAIWQIPIHWVLQRYLSPMPGLRLKGTGNRTGILIHPGHPPDLYLSSTGCFNPTNALSAGQTMDSWDSRTRVIGLIDNLRSFSPSAFQNDIATQIAHAWMVVNG